MYPKTNATLHHYHVWSCLVAVEIPRLKRTIRATIINQSSVEQPQNDFSLISVFFHSDVQNLRSLIDHIFFDLEHSSNVGTFEILSFKI